MPETRKKCHREFREGAVRVANETNKSIAGVARDLGSTRAPLGLGWRATARPVRAPTGYLGGVAAEVIR